MPKVKNPLVVSKAANTSTNGTEDGEVTATGSQNLAEFLSPVSVGGQTLVMDFDTGSSDMWVFNTNLAASSQTGHTIYDPTKSTAAATVSGATFDISYGDGSFANGPVGTDQVDIGGATVQAQTIGLPNNVSTSFVDDTASNGLLGLAFSSLNTVQPNQAKTFFDNVAGNLSQQVFTANLRSNSTGSYEFGSIDTTQFQGSLNQVTVDDSNGFWQFTSTTFVVGDGATQQNTDSGTAIADTGTSLLLVDPSVLNGYYTQVTGAIDATEEVGGVVFPCNSSLPDIAVATGDSMATVSGSNMNFADAGVTNNAGQDLCFGGLQSNEGSSFQIFGDVFFRSQFVAFQKTDPPSLGIAPHAF